MIADRLNRALLKRFSHDPAPGTRPDPETGEVPRAPMFTAHEKDGRLEIVEHVLSGRKRDKTRRTRVLGTIGQEDIDKLDREHGGACAGLSAHGGKIAAVLLDMLRGERRPIAPVDDPE